MGLSQSGANVDGQKLPTWLILVLLAVGAFCVAKAAASDVTIPIGPQPTPSASVSAR